MRAIFLVLLFLSSFAYADYYACEKKNEEWEQSCNGWDLARKDHIKNEQGMVYFIDKGAKKNLWLHEENLCVEVTSNPEQMGLAVPVLELEELKQFISYAEGKIAVTNCSLADSQLTACGNPLPEPDCIQGKIYLYAIDDPKYDPDAFTCDGKTMNYVYEEVKYDTRSANDKVYCMKKYTEMKNGSVLCWDCKYSETYIKEIILKKKKISSTTEGTAEAKGNGLQGGGTNGAVDVPTEDEITIEETTVSKLPPSTPPKQTPRHGKPGRMHSKSIGSKSR